MEQTPASPTAGRHARPELDGEPHVKHRPFAASVCSQLCAAPGSGGSQRPFCRHGSARCTQSPPWPGQQGGKCRAALPSRSDSGDGEPARPTRRGAVVHALVNRPLFVAAQWAARAVGAVLHHLRAAVGQSAADRRRVAAVVAWLIGGAVVEASSVSEVVGPSVYRGSRISRIDTANRRVARRRRRPGVAAGGGSVGAPRVVRDRWNGGASPINTRTASDWKVLGRPGFTRTLV